jgi:membrane-associated phospholipid phosphatase
LRFSVALVAERFAAVEVLLMLALAARGKRESAARMLVGVGLVYVACEVLGKVWPRDRPFEESARIESLVAHEPGRSFPSRHVASGLAMAAIGGREHPQLGQTMALVAWLLGVSRVAAGLHYPSVVLAGALLGRFAGYVLGK